MKKIKFEEIEKKKGKFILIEREKKIRRRPRDKNEEKILDKLLNARIEKFFKKGKLKEIGKRKYRLKI